MVPRLDAAYPVEKYPVLRKVLASRNGVVNDIEAFYTGMQVKEALFRYDALFINTMEFLADLSGRPRSQFQGMESRFGEKQHKLKVYRNT